MVVPPGRKPTPGEGQYSYAGDDEPTRPGNPTKDDRAAVLVRLYGNLTPDERKRLVLLADAWFRCGANGRALVEGVANELAGR